MSSSPLRLLLLRLRGGLKVAQAAQRGREGLMTDSQWLAEEGSREKESGAGGGRRKKWDWEGARRRRRRGRNGKRPPAQTPLKQKHPFSSENKPPSQDLREWATSAGRGSSNEGQDVPLRTHLRRAEGQKPEYIDPSLSLCHCPALPSHPGRVASEPPFPKKHPVLPLPARPLLPLLPAACWAAASEAAREGVELYSANKDGGAKTFRD